MYKKIINYKKNGKQKFKNGCTMYYGDDDYLSLCDENEEAWIGVTPFGQDAFICKDKNIEKVNRWLKFWDEDRDESGRLINN